MDDLATWLGTVLDDLEQLAKAATPGPWQAVTPSIPAPPAYLFSQPAGDDPLVFGEVGALADAQHIIHWDPARVLAEVEAKRAILRAYVPLDADPHPGQPCTNDIDGDPAGELYVRDEACERHVEASRHLIREDLVLRALALPYCDRPGWKPEWAPER